MRGNVVPPEPKVLQGPRETGRGDSGGEEDNRKRVRWPCGDAAGVGHAGNVSASPTQDPAGACDAEQVVDAREPVRLSQQGLSTGAAGLSSRETARRPQLVGRNESPVRYRLRWAADLARRLRNPLTLLLWVAAGLSWMVAATNVMVAILTVVLLNAAVVLNAALMLIQVRRSEGTVEAHGRIVGFPDHRLLLGSMVVEVAFGAAMIFMQWVSGTAGCRCGWS